MLESTHHWLSPIMVNETRYEKPFDSSNNNNNSQFSQYIEPMWASLSLIIIILFTVCGNSLVCIAVIRERHLRNTTNYFLTSLAFTDCLVACLVMPVAVTIELTGHFPFNALTCNVWSTFDICCSTSSIWHMSVMSLDRYLTLKYPLKYGRNKRRSLMAYKIITIWLISFAICLPIFILGLVDSTNVYNEKTRACFPVHRAFKLYGSFVAFFIPLIIMIVTYALTMSALQQAYTTKKKRYTKRQKMHAVMNFATMAMKWKRVVNNEIMNEQKNSIESMPIKSDNNNQTINLVSFSKSGQRKRASSLLINEHNLFSNKNLTKRIFVSNTRLNETLKPLASIAWYHRREKHLQPLPEKSIEQSSPLPTRHLDPNLLNNINVAAKRSHSCTPLLNVEDNRNGRRRSSSVNTLLQLRRDSAKITEELANLSAQLTGTINTNESLLTGKQTSLSIHDTNSINNHQTPTIDQLLAAKTLNQPIMIPSSFRSVDTNITATDNQQRTNRLHNTDIQLVSLELNNDKSYINNNSNIPNSCVANDSKQNLSRNIDNKSTTDYNDNYNSQSVTCPLTSSSKLDRTCQRIKDWITITTTSSSVLDHNSNLKPSCVTSINATEDTPMLADQKPYAESFRASNLKRYFPHIDQLYGPTSLPNSNSRLQQHQQQLLLVDDHVASVHNLASLPRNSICSLTSSMLAARILREHRPSTTSSIGSFSQQGIRKRAPRLNDGISQASFQMVSLDTEDSSSGSSSLTHQSNNIQSMISGVGASISFTSDKTHPTFRNLTKTSVSNERKAMRVLLVIFAIFIILWTPFFVINLLSCFIQDMHPIFISVATWLGYCSSGANPIIYTIFSRSFRRAFINILTCRKVISSHRSQMLSPSCHSMTMSVARKMSTVSKGQADIR